MSTVLKSKKCALSALCFVSLQASTFYATAFQPVVAQPSAPFQGQPASDGASPKPLPIPGQTPEEVQPGKGSIPLQQPGQIPLVPPGAAPGSVPHLYPHLA
ncbi:MAG: hypothetical protein HC908_18070 [Calothrix sp. SM1_7_51]|nr:hypothetical protein [Calothrix sp. SM1_7_51]